MARRQLAALAVIGAVVVGGCAQEKATPAQQTPASASSTAAAPSSTSQRPTPSATPTPSQTPTPTPTPTVSYVLRSGAVDPLVKELQARLRQLDLFPYYDVIETYGPMTTQGLATFQRNNGLVESGDLDDASWAALQSATKKPSADELANMIPGAPIFGANDVEDLKEIQQRLSQLGLWSGTPDGALASTTAAITQFQVNQGVPQTGQVDQRTYDRLLSVTRQPTPPEIRGEKGPIGGFYQDLDPRCLQGRVLCLSMGQKRLSWVVDGKALLTVEARYGNAENPSRPGVFKVWLKNPHAVSTIFEERSEMPWSLFYDEARAVHYSQSFADVGWYGWSHGCANTRDWEATKWLYDQVNIGDTVVVY